jgi:hypothetical protein
MPNEEILTGSATCITTSRLPRSRAMRQASSKAWREAAE